jgi:hypothetical protein
MASLKSIYHYRTKVGAYPRVIARFFGAHYDPWQSCRAFINGMPA